MESSPTLFAVVLLVIVARTGHVVSAAAIIPSQPTNLTTHVDLSKQVDSPANETKSRPLSRLTFDEILLDAIADDVNASRVPKTDSDSNSSITNGSALERPANLTEQPILNSSEKPDVDWPTENEDKGDTANLFIMTSYGDGQNNTVFIDGIIIKSVSRPN